MNIKAERFLYATGQGRKSKNKDVGKRGEELVVELCEKHGIHAFRTEVSNHPIDVIIDDTYGAEVKVFLAYKEDQVRMCKKQRARKRRFCETAGLKPVVIAIRKLGILDYEVLYGSVMKGYRLENMSSFQEFLDKNNGGRLE